MRRADRALRRRHVPPPRWLTKHQVTILTVPTQKVADKTYAFIVYETAVLKNKSSPASSNWCWVGKLTPPFTLAVAGLGKHTNQGSSLLIMMIMGGGVIAALQGWVADEKMLGIQFSYIVGALCFAYLAFYAIRVKSILKSQGIDYDTKVSGGH